MFHSCPASEPFDRLPVLLTREQAGALLQISISSLDRRIRAGEIPAVKLGRGKSGNAVRIPRDELLQSLGLLSSTSRVRDDQAAVDRELAEAHAALGITP